jgi:hypothetical protein
MTIQNAVRPIRDLPSMVLRCIRDGSMRLRPETNQQDLQILSRHVARADAAGHDASPLMPAYADAVRGSMSEAVDWTDGMDDIHETILGLVKTPAYAASTFWRDAGRPSSIADLSAAIVAWTAARVEEQDVPVEQANSDIRAEMDRVCALHPRLGLSYGYIGNFERGPIGDDRSFMIFTQVQTMDASHGQTFGMGSHAYEELAKLRTLVLGRLEHWARELDERLDAGTVRLRSTRHLNAA